jgi:hypothetical protein
MTALRVIAVFCAGLQVAQAFGVPVSHLAGVALSTPLAFLPTSTVLLSDETTEAVDAIVNSADTGGLMDQAGGILQTVLVVATAILFLLAGLTYVAGAILIPAAAKELEKECKELAPELWDEYMAKLGEGETIAQRPDLMEELGKKLNPIMDAKIKAAQMGQSGTTVVDDDAGTVTIGSKNQWVDAEIEEDDKKDNEQQGEKLQ